MNENHEINTDESFESGEQTEQAEDLSQSEPHTGLDIFLSYSSKNKNVADAIVADFEQHGIKCWYAPRDIIPGQEWVSAIKGAIEASKVLVLVYTGDSNNSRQVMNEVAVAFNAGKTIIPFRLTGEQMNNELEYYLTRVHWLDALSTPLHKHIHELREYVSAILHQTPVSVPDHQERSENIEKKKNIKMIILGAVGAAVVFALILVITFFNHSGVDDMKNEQNVSISEQKEEHKDEEQKEPEKDPEGEAEEKSEKEPEEKPENASDTSASDTTEDQSTTSDEETMDITETWRLGKSYYEEKKYEEAFEYLIKADDKIAEQKEELGLQELSELKYELGFIYGNIKNQSHKAAEYMEESATLEIEQKNYAYAAERYFYAGGYSQQASDYKYALDMYCNAIIYGVPARDSEKLNSYMKMLIKASGYSEDDVIKKCQENIKNAIEKGFIAEDDSERIMTDLNNILESGADESVEDEG